MKDYELPPNYAATGPASEKDCPTITIPNLLKQTLAQHADKPALRVERVGGTKEGGKRTRNHPSRVCCT